MGLTTRKHQGELVARECPHYYEMTLPNGQKRHCGTMKDVECVLSIYPNAIYNKILLPPTPDTVNVSAESLGQEEALQEAAKSLPESQSIKLEL